MANTQLPQGRGLLIAEKSSARKDLEAAYNKHKSELPYTLDFQQFHGHVVQLKMPGEIKDEWSKWDMDNLPMIPDDWEYVPESDPKRYNDVLNTIKNGNYDFLIDAGDFEREGQLIQDAFFSTLPEPFKSMPIYRLWANDMTDSGLAKGMKSLLLPDDNIPNAGTIRNLSEAAFIRARFDWLLGINSTQLLSLKSNTHINSGRVKTPILKIIVERELAIRNFVVKPFWTLKLTFAHPNGTYEGTLIDEEGGNKQFTDKAEAEAFAKSLSESSEGKITKLSIKNVSEKAPKFYAISSLQGDAADIYGMSMGDSLAALQSLYEKKILSYPRTDSHSITKEMAQETEKIIDAVKFIPQLEQFTHPDQAAIDKFKTNKYYVNDADARAHTALITLPGTPYSFDKLSDNEQKVLYLVGRSVVLAFLPPIQKEKTEIITEVNGYNFKTNGSRIVDKGYSVAVPEYSSNDTTVPKVAEGDTPGIDKQDLKEGKTTPPKRYTVKTLIGLLENVSRLLEDDEEKLAMKKAEGLGRPSTRTAILDSLIAGKMIATKGKKQEYSATDFGIEIIENINSSPLCNVELTAQWESKLQDVESGDLPAATLYNEMVKYTKQVISQLKSLDIEIQSAPDFGDGPVGKLPSGNEVIEAKNGYFDSEFSQYMDERSKAQEKGEPEPAFHGLWVPKRINSDSQKMTGSITRKDMQALLAGDPVKKHFLWKKKNSESDVNLILKDNKLAYDFGKSKSDVKTKSINIDGHTVELVSIDKDGKHYEFYDIDKDSGNELKIWKNVAGHAISEKELDELLKTNNIKNVTMKSKKGNDFVADLVLSNGKLSFAFNDAPKTVIKTVKGVDISEGSGTSKTGNKYEYFELSGKMKGRIYKTMSGAEITMDNVESLINNGYFERDDFVSKKGKNFSAKVKFNDGKASFDFG